MTRRAKKKASASHPPAVAFKNQAQADAWESMQEHDITFLLGAAGSGKTFLAMAYAINGVLSGRFTSIVLTRPIVPSESLGYLPGTAEDKIDPYMKPLNKAMDTILGKNTVARTTIMKAVEKAPLAFMRGDTFSHSVCILDEAQNATYQQLKMFLTRLGVGSKMIITGDHEQSDLPFSPPPLMGVVEKLKSLGGYHKFDIVNVVRHPLVAAFLKRLD